MSEFHDDRPPVIAWISLTLILMTLFVFVWLMLTGEM